MVITDLRNVPILTQTNPFHRIVYISLKTPFVAILPKPVEQRGS